MDNELLINSLNTVGGMDMPSIVDKCTAAVAAVAFSIISVSSAAWAQRIQHDAPLPPRRSRRPAERPQCDLVLLPS